MTFDSLTLTILGIGSLFLGMIIYKIVDDLIYIGKYYWNRDNFPRTVDFDESKACQGPHKWESTELFLQDMEIRTYLICTECGTISGTDKQLNAAGTEVHKNHAVKKAARKELGDATIKRFIEIIEADRNMWIKTHSKEFGKDETKNQEMLVKFSKFTVESMEGATQRVTREFKGKA